MQHKSTGSTSRQSWKQFRRHNDVITLFNITSSIYAHINYQQILLHIHSILANLRDFLSYMRQIAMYAMVYIDAVTTSILSPHVLSSRRFERNADAHRNGITINYAFFSIIK